MYSNWIKLGCKFKGQKVGIKLIGGGGGELGVTEDTSMNGHKHFKLYQ